MEKDKNIKGDLKSFFVGTAASLFASILLFWIKESFEIGSFLSLRSILEMFTNYGFYIYWLLFIALFILIRIITKKIIEKKQDEFPGFFSLGPGHNPSHEKDMEYSGLDWNISFDVNRRDPIYGNIKEVDIHRVGGPYCTDDKREMKESRTYFGKYKYNCPKCGKKKILLKNAYTLENEVKDEFRSQFR